MDTIVVDASIDTRGQPPGTAAMIAHAYPPTDTSRPAAGAAAHTLTIAEAGVRTTPCAPREDVRTVRMIGRPARRPRARMTNSSGITSGTVFPTSKV